MTQCREAPIGIYIHVPYCRVICPYCDFVRARRTGDAPREFADALIREIRSFRGDYEVASIFFGGGTPSMLSPPDFVRIVEALKARFEYKNVEFSIEANPDDVIPAAAGAWRDAGVNRISLGVQSFDEATLTHLGRCHDVETALAACELVRTAYLNWGIDLIFGSNTVGSTEGEMLARFEHDLEQVLAFAPPHVSAYGLTIEPGTPFALLPGVSVPEDVSLELYRIAVAGLAGYEHYEVSNFAIPGFASVHNRIYWRNEGYAGLGPGAVSYLKGVRSRNSRSISGYLRQPGRKEEQIALSGAEERVETLIQHFRTRAGIESAYYEHRFKTTIETDFGDTLKQLMLRGLIDGFDGGYRPTQSGFELNNEIGLALVGG